MSKREQPERASTGDWLSPQAAAAKVAVHVDTIYDACADGRLQSVKLGHSTIRIKPEWLEAWMLAHAR